MPEAAGYRRILAALDFSEHADRAFAAAAELARREGAELTLLHVVSPVGPPAPGMKAGDQPPDDHALAEELKGLMAERYTCRAPELECRMALRRGYPSEEILAQLRDDPADLVVLGAQGLSGMGLVLLGSVAERVSRRSPCDCLVVKFDKSCPAGLTS